MPADARGRLLGAVEVLEPQQWHARQAAHLQRVSPWTEPFRERRSQVYDQYADARLRAAGD